MKFKIGDVVKIIGYNFFMSVDAIDRPSLYANKKTIKTIWFNDNGKSYEGFFPADILQLIE